MEGLDAGNIQLAEDRGLGHPGTAAFGLWEFGQEIASAHKACGKRYEADFRAGLN